MRRRLSCDITRLNPDLTQKILKCKWDVYEVIPCPGLILIKNPLTSFGQRYFISRCLQDYAKHPNPTNLQSKHNISIESSWWSELNRISDEKLKKKFREALRWTTLGLHHDWNTKVYNEKLRNDFPRDLKYLIQEIARILNYESYQPEAAIVNFYPLNATLAGHTDHSEFCNEPLFSISLGQPAIFLIGGETRDVKPLPLMLRSGDVAIFTGNCRLSYHAVPKILKTDEKPWCIETEDIKNIQTPDCFDRDTIERVKTWDSWKACDEYVSLCRININVRQVYETKVTCDYKNDTENVNNKKLKV